ncbi:MAG: nuclear transport factor 2 family protein [Tsuneonella suprasediminis]|uniref:Nuclear transport factor 2 family protein n=1 Tax=Tsuneonella suprasediminis TaxID=2306996 RepID=A0A419QZJ1_9SPHN|nr:nuclear transport factor 2 family protein [Tsuneonella suprasediminis]RJX66410.1 nuclear transport factor 2 family protein [Tsuneonella suprasediminis]UBS32085.1 nuclear transport factor 2 family protein [Altererythrobacter sp. N1]
MEMFAANWIANWNARDLDAILAHFAEDARFISPLAAELTGSPIIEGKASLRAYLFGLFHSALGQGAAQLARRA